MPKRLSPICSLAAQQQLFKAIPLPKLWGGFILLYTPMSKEPVKTLTIGGSDSGGAAGIQADLKTWTALRVYGMSVITAVTAQNSVSVDAIQFMPPALVAAQIDAVLADYGAQAIKTGFLGQKALIEEASLRLQAHGAGPLVVDPVLVNHTGQPMFSTDIAAAYRRELLPLAELLTPNWREAVLLAGQEIAEIPPLDDLERIAISLCETGCEQVLITGVPAGEMIIDYWFDGAQFLPLTHPRIETNNRHGSGDTLSAAICANLAVGMDMASAISSAQAFTMRALAAASGWKLGRGHGPLSHFLA